MLLGKVDVRYRRLCRLNDLLKVPIVERDGYSEFFGGSTNVKSLGHGFPDFDRMTKLAKSPEKLLSLKHGKGNELKMHS